MIPYSDSPNRQDIKEQKIVVVVDAIVISGNASAPVRHHKFRNIAQSGPELRTSKL